MLVSLSVLPPRPPRSEIDKGLRTLSQIRPAGETYMHEGMKAVSQSGRERIYYYNIYIVYNIHTTPSSAPPTFQVSEQMKAQTSPPSGSIIIVLTDGKLEVYPYELSVREVRAPAPL